MGLIILRLQSIPPSSCMIKMSIGRCCRFVYVCGARINRGGEACRQGGTGGTEGHGDSQAGRRADKEIGKGTSG